MTLLLLFCLYTPALVAKELQHFVYFENERERITEKSFLENPQLKGAQLKYSWKELEPKKNDYHFDAIKKDLETLTKNKKALFIQIQDVTFDVKNKLVPHYLTTDPEYSGGVDLHYTGEGKEAKAEGWIARRWDKEVRIRFQKLLAELGKAFDGKIEGINLPETAFAFGERKDLLPQGFTFSGYRDAVIENMVALKQSFPKSVAMQYANFMPGEWRPDDDHHYLRDIYAAAIKHGVAVGGPDLLPYKKGQMNHTYHFLAQVKGKVPVGIAAQEDNYKHINPRTQKPVSVVQMLTFAKEELKADYLFWCTQEPFYSKEVLPLLKK